MSILVPVYNEAECLHSFYSRLSAVLERLPCASEILFVNDGSTDDSLDTIRMLHRLDSRVAYIDLSRNFGKETAMGAGIDYIRGDALLIIDADLQHPPELIPEMLQSIAGGYDDVYGYRKNRNGETRMKKWLSKKYYRFLEILSDIPVQKDTGDFRMFGSKAIAALRLMKENERNMKGLFSYIGFRKKAVFYEPDVRIAGHSKWNYLKLADLAIKGLTSFSVIPLRLVSIAGIVTSVAAFIYLVVVFVKAAIWGDSVGGYPSLMCILLLVGGFIMLALGIIGEYLGIIYNETKRRPGYFVNEYCCHEDGLTVEN
ncbi:MAG: glycosyltransferase family 2 protein [Bacteroidales bacterium]|nr:glycosyltransferase family 2 protein [Bacteroidales bacterium]